MIRAYINQDRLQVMDLLKQNTPKHFDISEESAFENYWDSEIEDYFVSLEDSKIIGAGGINYFLEEKMAKISWDIIDPQAQGKGIGKELTQFRINHLNKNPNVHIITVRTSQLVYTFYEKMGFKLVKVKPNFWAKNFHLYQMEMTNKK
ncbi:GNAT family N-acetyltransferase [Bizionia argentinensis JUB59]|uniref:GNAT family N-acetyltransferase n=1 Tax=Bizionia argentinensis JUB59 TaxID=1046627 RepID=G2E9M8_9FLAO|nr:GNAT family N-acetyltransferase [Bizionia argentinensis]EGV45078.1 GNAT family N-acetyltransferase [Bizionia argentinensis JUB59]